ncbi:MAG: hydrogenase 4 subunit B [Rhodospirillaceae bacterium]|nr:hydrogenase 4 subunit B [Rhodospirillaceae bacterium]
MPVVLALILIAGLLGIALVAVAFHRRAAGVALTYGLAGMACLGLLGVGFVVLASGAEPSGITLPLGLPWIGARFRLDAVAAVFLIIANLGGAAASAYGLGYGRHEHDQGRVLPFYAAFLAGVNLVLLADDAFTFLLSWEFMSLGSWALVLAHHREAGNARAGYVYIVMASFGTLALLLAFGLLAGAGGGYGFDAIRGLSHPDGIRALILILVLIGAGSKAGLVPLHAWLPLAHPAAPSHVSALMSGVMTKVAIYGFIRIVFDLLGPPDWWWSVIVLGLGGATAVIGILYALMEHELKRLLAYSTVENVGIVFVGLGLALAFRANGLQWAAALAVTAALFHAFNHMLFKSLLFFGAGAVLHATGEKSMERLGGLIHRMPKTAFAFLVGAAAISALPPLNGFASEWLTFQTVLLSPQLPQWMLKFMVPAVGALLALSAALAATCFVKAFGITFLGRPRSPAAAEAAETDRWSLAAMLILAALCLLAGILPGFVVDALAPATAQLAGARMPVQSAVPWWSIVPIAESRSSYNGLLVFAFAAISGGLAAMAIHRFASRRLRRAPAWDCGFPDPRPATQYGSSSFAQPIRRVFGARLFAAREHVVMPAPGDMRPARFRVRMRDLIWDRLYLPVAGTVEFLARRLNPLQSLTIRRYLTLVFFSLITMLTVLAIWR